MLQRIRCEIEALAVAVVSARMVESVGSPPLVQLYEVEPGELAGLGSLPLGGLVELALHFVASSHQVGDHQPATAYHEVVMVCPVDDQDELVDGPPIPEPGVYFAFLRLVQPWRSWMVGFPGLIYPRDFVGLGQFYLVVLNRYVDRQ